VCQKTDYLTFALTISFIEFLFITIIQMFSGFLTSKSHIKYTPLEQQNTLEKSYIAAVTRNWRDVINIPTEHCTPLVCLSAISQNGKAIKYIRATNLTPELCLAAVMQNGMALMYSTANAINQDLFLAAINQNGKSIGYIPSDDITSEMCFAAVEQNGMALGYIPEEALPSVIVGRRIPSGTGFKYTKDGASILREQEEEEETA